MTGYPLLGKRKKRVNLCKTMKPVTANRGSWGVLKTPWVSCRGRGTQPFNM